MTNSRKIFGRRKADLVLPLVLSIVLALVFLWAINNQIQQQHERELNARLRGLEQTQDRLIKIYEKKMRANPATKTGTQNSNATKPGVNKGGNNQR